MNGYWGIFLLYLVTLLPFKSCLARLSCLDTMTFNDRRRQVEGRGIHAEATPRSSTPYHEQLTTRSFSGTYRARGRYC